MSELMDGKKSAQNIGPVGEAERLYGRMERKKPVRDSGSVGKTERSSGRRSREVPDQNIDLVLRREETSGLADRINSVMSPGAALEAEGLSRPAGVRLSARMRALAALVTPGSRLADVGTDHGYLPIALALDGKIPSAIAMDVREGPLRRARVNIAAARLEDRIETRLSDGLRMLLPGEVDTVLIAGMGGFLVQKILSEGQAALAGVRELVLQPQSETPRVRAFLRSSGYVIADEDMVKEDGKFYVMMRAVRGEGENGSQNVYEIPATRKPGSERHLRGENGSQNRHEASAVPTRFSLSEPGENGSPRRMIGQGTEYRCVHGNGAAPYIFRERVSRGSVNVPPGDRREAFWADEGYLRRLEDSFGPVLLRERHPVLREWVEREQSLLEKIQHRLSVEGRGESARERLREITEQLRLLEDARRLLEE